jgi:hypothetical protein
LSLLCGEQKRQNRGMKPVRNHPSDLSDPIPVTGGGRALRRTSKRDTPIVNTKALKDVIIEVDLDGVCSDFIGRRLVFNRTHYLAFKLVVECRCCYKHL